MLDVAVAYNRFRFVGDEFLTWLWFIIDNEPDTITNVDKDQTILEVGNRVVLENHQRESVEKVTIKGDQAGMEEGLLALQKGALVTEINLVLRQADKKWQFNLKGESLNISGFKVPEVARPQTREDLEGFVLEKIYLYGKVATFIENIFNLFIHLRLSKQWTQKVVPKMQSWFNT